MKAVLPLFVFIDALPLQMAEDDPVVYDSTRARFWFFNEHARDEIVQGLGRVPQGRILPDAELARLQNAPEPAAPAQRGLAAESKAGALLAEK